MTTSVPTGEPVRTEGPRFHPLIEERLHLLQGHASFADCPPAVLKEWDAPYGPAESWDLQIADRQVPGPHGPVPVRVYTPAGDTPPDRPCLVWIHGGGFVAGDLDMPEAHEVAQRIAGRADAVVVSVFYRLCPREGLLGLPEEGTHESTAAVRFPIPLDDVIAAIGWVRDNAAALGIDEARIAIGGASAGANLAAGATLRLADEGRTPWQTLLLYPLVHPELPATTPEMAQAFAITPRVLNFSDESVRAVNVNYLGAGLETATPYAYAGISDNLAVFPPTLVDNCEFDTLRRSGERFVEQLRDAGVDVEAVVSRGVPHGHLNCIGFPPAQESTDRMADRLRRAATP